MYVIFVSCRVKAEHLDDFIAAMLDDARGSVDNEPGCRRFDVVQDLADPTRISLYEIYDDRAAFDQHLLAPHLIKWKETVKDWYEVPMDGYHCRPLFMTDTHQRAGNGG